MQFNNNCLDMEPETVYVNVSFHSRQYMVEACSYSCHQCRLGIGGFGEFGEKMRR